MDFKDEYDLIYTHIVLQHTNLESKKEILKRVHKALKKGGLLVIEENAKGETHTIFHREGWIDLITSHKFILMEEVPSTDDSVKLVFRKA